MDLATRILDPDGEVTIILRHAKLSQADEAIQESSESSETSDDTPVGEQHSPVEQPNAEMATGQQPEPEVQEFRYQVSAKHLTFASPVFKRLLTGGWKESTIYSENVYVEITASDWDDEAFAILLRVIHGQYHEVPQKVTLHMLAEIGVIADYYDCKQALLIMIDMWVNALEEKMPSDYSVTTMRWIWVSWYFNLPKNFQESTSVAMASSTGVIDKCDFPIPDKVIDMMNTNRQGWITHLLKSLHDTLADFLGISDTPRGCSFACRSIMYGALALYMQSHDLLSPRPECPYTKLSYKDLVSKISTFQSPTWCPCPKEPDRYSDYPEGKPHICSSSRFVYLIAQCPMSPKGLTLESINNA